MKCSLDPSHSPCIAKAATYASATLSFVLVIIASLALGDVLPGGIALPICIASATVIGILQLVTQCLPEEPPKKAERTNKARVQVDGRGLQSETLRRGLNEILNRDSAIP